MTRTITEITQDMDNKILHPWEPISKPEIWILLDNGFEFFKTYRICDYSGNLGPKKKEGDKQSPEGSDPAQLNP